MLRDSLALLLAVRCQQDKAVRQLLAEIYQNLDENRAKNLMVKTIHLLSPKERDWLRDLV
jgi:hypothetical protein